MSKIFTAERMTKLVVGQVAAVVIGRLITKPVKQIAVDTAHKYVLPPIVSYLKSKKS